MRDFWGVVHVLPLPGSVRAVPFAEARERALGDARALVEGGADGMIVENFGDAPFARGPVEPVTVAALTAIAVELSELGIPLGINVLRNDARSALSIAAIAGAELVRVNVHTGAMVTDQGLIEGDARGTLELRTRLCPEVRLAADVLVKHATPLGDPAIEDVARDTAYRGLADVLIVTGSGTGRPHDPGRVATVRSAVPDRPVWVGSGVTPETAVTLEADGAIVGTWLHERGDRARPLDVERVRGMAAALKGSAPR